MSKIRVLFDKQTQNSVKADVINVKDQLMVVYDFAENGGAIGTIQLSEYLPKNARVTKGWYEVLTTFTSSTDTATIAVNIPTDDAAGLLAAIAINNGGNPWDQGLHELIQTGTAANMSEKTTAIREITLTVAVQVLTAGKCVFYLDYITDPTLV